MDTKFSCSKCGQHIVTDETDAEMTVQCPTCGQNLVVPQRVCIPPIIAEHQANQIRPVEQPQAHSMPESTKIVIGVISSALVVAIVVIVVMTTVLLSSKRPQRAAQEFATPPSLPSKQTLSKTQDIGNTRNKQETFAQYKKSADLGSPYGMCGLGYCYLNGWGVEKEEQKAIEWFKKAADLGYSEGVYGLGKYYKSIADLVKNKQAAFECFKKAAMLGCAGAMIEFGDYYENGWGIEKNEQQALAWYKEAANLGNSAAMYRMGKCYQNGVGVAQDLEEAIKWFKRAAELDNSDGRNELGHKPQLSVEELAYDSTGETSLRLWNEIRSRTSLAYNSVFGAALNNTPDSVFEALQTHATELAALPTDGVDPGLIEFRNQLLVLWSALGGRYVEPAVFKMVSDIDKASHTECIRKRLSTMYGLEFSRMPNLHVAVATRIFDDDEEKTRRFFRSGDPDQTSTASPAIEIVSTPFQPRGGGTRDEHKSFVLFKTLANSGDPFGMSRLSYCYCMGWGIEKNTEETLNWAKKAADLGDAFGMFCIGYAYGDMDSDLANKFQEASRWFKRAADLGEPWGMYRLGLYYLYGLGVEKDEQKAIEWLKKAAELGLDDAMHSLGESYLNGRGVAKDEQKAVEWFKKAAELGHPNAMHSFGECYLNGRGVAKDEQKAVECFKKSAESKNQYAMYKLGYCYRNGLGVEKDEQKAIEWFKKAAELGYPVAKKELER